MGVVISFRKDNVSPEDVLRYFFHEINEAHGLELSLTDPRIKPHLAALKSLAEVYVKTAATEVKGIDETLQEPLLKEITKLRARFLAETVLGVLQEESIVHIVPDHE